MNTYLRGVVFAAIIVIESQNAIAAIHSRTTYALDLNIPSKLSKETTWSEPDHVAVTNEGLGWGTRNDKGYRDFWLQTEPIGIGESWRPTSAVSIEAKIDQPVTSGLMYARYSADRAHWTTWQSLKMVDPEGTKFHGELRVPYREQADYVRRRMEYGRRNDVPWSSDEEALAIEILERDPTYFAKKIPFVGYVQFSYEGGMEAGHRLKNVHIEMNWMISGKHHAPQIKDVEKGRDVVWRFEAK